MLELIDQSSVTDECAELVSRLVSQWQQIRLTSLSQKLPGLDAEIRGLLDELVAMFPCAAGYAFARTDGVSGAGDATSPFKLTKRECDVLYWLAVGKSVSEVGMLMNISKCTVRTYIQRILRKFEVSNRTHAVSMAIKLRLITI